MPYQVHISFPSTSFRAKSLNIHHLHTVRCSEARALRLSCLEHINLRIAGLFSKYECHVDATVLLWP